MFHNRQYLNHQHDQYHEYDSVENEKTCNKYLIDINFLFIC